MTPFVYVKTRCDKGKNGVKRLLNIFSFYHNLQKASIQYAKKNEKPDVIIASSIHPLTLLAGLKISKKLGVPCICEIRDLWPEELVAMGSLKRNSIITKVLYHFEHNIYKKANALIFTMEGAYQYIQDRKWESDIPSNKVFYINNGVDLEAYRENVKKYTVDDPDLLDDEIYKIVYTGAIRLANGIDRILDVAKELKEYRDIRFLLYGDGNQKDFIQQRIISEKIDNVIYKGRVEKKEVPYVLSKSSINLLNYLTGDLFEYGCSNNKLFEYMASGKPIICSIKMNYSILSKYQCGIELESPEQLKDAILSIYNNPNAGKKYSENANNAIQNFDFRKHTGTMISIIEHVLTGADA